MSFDLSLFTLIHGLAGKAWPIDWLAIFFAEYLPYFLVVVLVALCFREPSWRRRLYCIAFGSLSLILSRGIMTETIRFFYSRPRPFTALGFQPLIGETQSGSFPSGHAAAYFALVVVVWVMARDGAPQWKRWSMWFTGGVILMAAARVFAGVHWPSDILGGAAIGIAAALAVRALLPDFSPAIPEERRGFPPHAS